jgi:hypothetical protein
MLSITPRIYRHLTPVSPQPAVITLLQTGERRGCRPNITVAVRKFVFKTAAPRPVPADPWIDSSDGISPGAEAPDIRQLPGPLSSRR